MIQKFMKGYKVKERYHMIVFEGRVLKDINKFSCNNDQIIGTCANFIKLSWRIYKRIKEKKQRLIREAAEREKLAKLVGEQKNIVKKDKKKKKKKKKKADGSKKGKKKGKKGDNNDDLKIELGGTLNAGDDDEDGEKGEGDEDGENEGDEDEEKEGDDAKEFEKE